eukprot:4706816-Amphidinium_carterae.1
MLGRDMQAFVSTHMPLLRTKSYRKYGTKTESSTSHSCRETSLHDNSATTIARRPFQWHNSEKATHKACCES